MSKSKTGVAKKKSGKAKSKPKAAQEEVQPEESAQVAETASTQEAKSEQSDSNTKSQKQVNHDSPKSSQKVKKGKKKTNKKDSKVAGKKRKEREAEVEPEEENGENVGIYDGLGDTAGKLPEDKGSESDYNGDLGERRSKRQAKATEKEREEKEGGDSETCENTKGIQEQVTNNNESSNAANGRKIKYKKKHGNDGSIANDGGKGVRYPSRNPIVSKILRMAEANDKRALQRNLEKRANQSQIINIAADLEARKQARLEKIMMKKIEDEEKAKRIRMHREAIEAEKNKKSKIIEEEILKGRWKLKNISDCETVIKKAMNNEPTKITEGFNYSFYRPIIESKNFVEDDIVCDVCLEAQGEDDDEIIICELCLSATHQLCYGKELTNGIPTDSWFCERCEEEIASLVEPLEIKCIFCNESKGILTKYTEKDGNKGKEVEVRLHDTLDQDDQVEDPLDSDIDAEAFFEKKLQKKREVSRWAHVSCINWTPGLYFADDEQYIVEGTVGPERYGHECYYCKKKNIGTYITCDFDDTCNVHFHARCAMKNGIIGPINSMDNQRDPKNPDNCILFCEKHKEPGIKAIEKLKQQLMIKEMENENKIESNE